MRRGAPRKVLLKKQGSFARGGAGRTNRLWRAGRTNRLWRAGRTKNKQAAVRHPPSGAGTGGGIALSSRTLSYCRFYQAKSLPNKNQAIFSFFLVFSLFLDKSSLAVCGKAGPRFLACLLLSRKPFSSSQISYTGFI